MSSAADLTVNVNAGELTSHLYYLQLMRDYSQEQRAAMAKDGTAMEDGAYPIATRADVEHAVYAIERAKDQPAAKRHIQKRAQALDAADLIPAQWGEEEAPEGMVAVRLCFGAEVAIESMAAEGEPLVHSKKPNQIFPLGKSKTLDGRKVWIDDDDSKAIMSDLSKRTNKLPWTYMHEKHGGESAGWFLPSAVKIHDGGIWTETTDWTAPGARKIANREFIYASGDAYGVYDKEGYFHPRRLRGVSLVDKPAFDGMQEVTLGQLEVAQISNPSSAPAASSKHEEKGSMKFDAETLARIGCKPDASEEEQMSAMKAFAEGHPMHGESKKKEFSEQPAGISVEQFNQLLEERFGKARTEQEFGAKVGALLSPAVLDGRITVAEKKDYEASLFKSPETFSMVESFIGKLPKGKTPVKPIYEPGVNSASRGPVELTVNQFGSGCARLAEELGVDLAVASSFLRDSGMASSNRISSQEEEV